MDVATLLRLLPIAMQFIQSASDPSTPAGQLAQEIRQLLFQHKAQLDHLAAVQPLVGSGYGMLPQQPSLEHLKTPEDVLQFIKNSPPAGGAAPGTTRR